jgi:Flp pilus assembly protein TadB
MRVQEIRWRTMQILDEGDADDKPSLWCDRLITLVIFSVLVIGYMLFAGSGVSKAQKRRMQALRYRHSESVDAKVDAQFKRAVAARKPKTYRVAGSGSRTEALAMRLNRTGKDWTVSQYAYTSLGLALGIAVVIFVFSRAPMLSLGVGLVAVGSVDPNRFFPGMGTLFLRMMAEALATAIGRPSPR